MKKEKATIELGNTIDYSTHNNPKITKKQTIEEDKLSQGVLILGDKSNRTLLINNIAKSAIESGMGLTYLDILSAGNSLEDIYNISKDHRKSNEIFLTELNSPYDTKDVNIPLVNFNLFDSSDPLVVAENINSLLTRDIGIADYDYFDTQNLMKSLIKILVPLDSKKLLINPNQLNKIKTFKDLLDAKKENLSLELLNSYIDYNYCLELIKMVKRLSVDNLFKLTISHNTVEDLELFYNDSQCNKRLLNTLLKHWSITFVNIKYTHPGIYSDTCDKYKLSENIKNNMITTIRLPDTRHSIVENEKLIKTTTLLIKNSIGEQLSPDINKKQNTITKRHMLIINDIENIEIKILGMIASLCRATGIILILATRDTNKPLKNEKHNQFTSNIGTIIIQKTTNDETAYYASQLCGKHKIKQKTKLSFSFTKPYISLQVTPEKYETIFPPIYFKEDLKDNEAIIITNGKKYPEKFILNNIKNENPPKETKKCQK